MAYGEAVSGTSFGQMAEASFEPKPKPRRMDANAAKLISIGDKLFANKAQLDELWQELAETFYPERANFTRTRIEGSEYATEMYESVPAQNRRDLAGSIGAILRPRGKEWFKPEPTEDKRKTDRAMRKCDEIRDTLRRLIYNGSSRFQKVSADADNDFVSFGNAVPILTENKDRSGFLFEMSHLRDNAWTVNRDNDVDVNHRKLQMTLRQVSQKWGEDALSEPQKKIKKSDPDAKCEIRHVVMPVEDGATYKRKKEFLGKKFASIYLNKDAQLVLQEGGYFEFPYLHRRWNVPDDSFYAYSPAAMLGLVDARVLQAQARVIMDQGELAVAPPLLARRNAVLKGIKNYAGAVTWIDAEYDERLGDAVRPLDVGGNIQLGLEMKQDTRKILEAAWFLNKLNLPSDKAMTAYETSERVAEYIRSAGPIFEPFESDNAKTLDAMFSMGLRLGYFGAVEEFPPELRGGEIKWEFDTPVQQAYRRLKVVRARETLEAIGPMIKITQGKVLDNFDMDKIALDTAEAIGGEAAWRKPKELVAQKRAADMKQAEQQKQMMAAEQMAKTGKHAGGALQSLSKAGQSIPGLNEQLAGLLPAPGPEGERGPPRDEEVQYPKPAADPFTDLGVGMAMPGGDGQQLALPAPQAPPDQGGVNAGA